MVSSWQMLFGMQRGDSKVVRFVECVFEEQTMAWRWMKGVVRYKSHGSCESFV